MDKNSFYFDNADVLEVRNNKKKILEAANTLKSLQNKHNTGMDIKF